MARPLRIEFEGALYHVTSRGNEQKPIFLEDRDRSSFLSLLAGVSNRFNWLCHAYCLMENHYHLIIETPDGNLSPGMRQLNGVFTQLFNKRHQRVGHLFQGRYRAVLVERESYLLQVCRYVVLNPVRADLVRSPEAWPWSSYRGTAGYERAHPCLTTAWILQQFGERMSAARANYREFIRDGISAESIWTEVKGQILLGDDDFVQQFRGHLRGQEGFTEIPKSQRLLGRPSLDRIFANKATGDRDLRNRKVAEAVEKHGYFQREVADFLGLHYSTISRLMTEGSGKQQE